MGITRHVPLPEPLRALTVPGVARPGAGDVPRDVGVVIVAAGRGTRAPGDVPKQFRWVAGQPMLLHSVRTFLARADVCAVVCVLPREYVADPPPWLMQNDLDRLLLSVGGDARQDSVRNGLEDLSPDARIVLVHDAARPFITDPMIDRVVASVRAGRGAVPALPVVDTLKEVNADGHITRTLDRHHAWRAQTPQGFARDLLERAHRAALTDGVTGTDDAALVERLGEPVAVVHGDERAFKITTDADFERAAAMVGGAPHDERGGERGRGAAG